MPPSTVISAPETYEASSDARKAITLATSWARSVAAQRRHSGHGFGHRILIGRGRVHLGVDGAGVNRIDGDAASAQFFGDRTRQNRDAGFGRSIDGVLRKPDLAHDAAHVDDPSTVAQVPSRFADRGERASQVDVHVGVVVGVAEASDGAGFVDARIVDENVESAVILDYVADELSAGVGRCRVGLVGLSRPARLRNRVDDLLRAIGRRVIANGDGRAVAGQTLSRCSADSARSARDEGDFSCEVRHEMRELSGGTIVPNSSLPMSTPERWFQNRFRFLDCSIRRHRRVARPRAVHRVRKQPEASAEL